MIPTTRNIIETVPVSDNVEATCVFCRHTMAVTHIVYTDDYKWFYRCEECNVLNDW